MQSGLEHKSTVEPSDFFAYFRKIITRDNYAWFQLVHEINTVSKHMKSFQSQVTSLPTLKKLTLHDKTQSQPISERDFRPMRFHCANQHHISIEIKLLINCHLQRSQMPGTKQIQ